MSDTATLVFFGVLFAALIFGIFFGAWKAYIPKGFAYFCGMFIGMGIMFYSMISSAIPSSAPRKQVTGRLIDIYSHGSGRSKTYTFDIVRDGGAIIGFREGVSPPRSSRGELLLVTYLDEHVAGKYPRAIAAENLTGPYKGYRNSVSADWNGPWLYFPLGIGIIFWCSIQSHKNRRNKGEDTTDNA